MLARNYRFTVLNSTGQTVAIAGVVIKGRRKKLGSTGALAYEATEASIMSNAGTIANAAYSSSSGIDNSTDLFLEGDFTVTAAVLASAAGDLTIYYEVSTDGGTTWPTPGNGVIVAAITVPATGSASVKHFTI